MPRAERADLERTIEEQEGLLLEEMTPLSAEPAEGEEERLTERLGALLAQRRRIEALRHAGALAGVTADVLVDEVDRRLALLGERLACERGEEDC
jgi:hypothetical protein